MKIELEVNDELVDEIVLKALKTAHACSNPKDVTLRADKKYCKKIRKALKEVIKHYSVPNQWEYIDREY